MTQGSLKIWHLHIKQWDGSFTSDRRFYNSDKYTADGGEEKHALLYAAGEKTRLGNFCGREPGNSYTDLKRTQPSLSPSNLSCTYAAEHKEVYVQCISKLQGTTHKGANEINSVDYDQNFLRNETEQNGIRNIRVHYIY